MLLSIEVAWSRLSSLSIWRMWHRIKRDYCLISFDYKYSHSSLEISERIFGCYNPFYNWLVCTSECVSIDKVLANNRIVITIVECKSFVWLLAISLKHVLQVVCKLWIRILREGLWKRADNIVLVCMCVIGWSLEGYWELNNRYLSLVMSFG